ncbi:DNA-processing protein DprA [Microbacterium mitrae]|uniref:DNA-protecting protein DprA n=1 Tax=Microbacterium mitrae TaxID=664640 RepID=A0A5C8HRT6_9MICO|nr:DNA-processing protein DprA [Microbacterium mitrae]TXK05763.1 DNA-protecting protein DprA [Microbacterium mitrae]
MNDERRQDAAARVILSLLAEPGDADIGALVTTYGAPKAVDIIRTGTHPPDVPQRTWTAATARWAPRLGVLDGHDQRERARRADARLVIPGDDEWPDAVDDLGVHAPLLLWVRGDATLLSSAQSVALVGARAATGYGEHVAGEFADALARGGASVVSGGAYGIDGAAHRAALGAGGVTIAVMAGGVDRPYPAGHAHLLAQIARAGVVASELPLGVAPSRWRFLSRNRVIAAMTDATVVVEAGWRSGSLNTAGHAASLGRPLGAVPGPITSPASMGCHRLMREFDAACVTTPEEIRELAGWLDEAATPERGADGDAGSATNRLIDALSVRAARDIDELARRTGQPRDEVQATVGLLMLEGALLAVDGGYVLANVPEGRG